MLGLMRLQANRRLRRGCAAAACDVLNGAEVRLKLNRAISLDGVHSDGLIGRNWGLGLMGNRL